MSSVSSELEIDVVRTQITNCTEEDGPVLYAYESKPAHSVDLENVLLDASYDEENPKTFGDILTHCQVINDSIQTLHKKFSAIHGKVTKIRRLQMNSVWHNHRTFGYSSRTFGHRLSREIKCQVKCRRPKKKNSAPVSDSISYNPTPLSMLQNAEGNSEASPMKESLPAQGALEPEQASSLPAQEALEPEEASSLPAQEALELKQASFLQTQNPGLTQDPHKLAPYAAQSFPTYCISKNFTQNPSYKSSVLSPGSSGSLVSTALLVRKPHHALHSSAAVTETVEQHSAHTKLMAGLTVQEIKSTSQSNISSPSVASFVAGSSVGTDQHILKRSCSHPSSWSVDEVVLFLEQSDSENFGPLSHLFREHAIDGKALLLLTKEAMIKYMDIKVGTALKVYNHIKGLKRKKSLKN